MAPIWPLAAPCRQRIAEGHERHGGNPLGGKLAKMTGQSQCEIAPDCRVLDFTLIAEP